MSLYTITRGIVRSALGCYFKKIRVEGFENIPSKTPLLITPNHQNALLDPLIIGAFLPLPIHYLTRSDVFKPWIKGILHRLNMLPIYRIRDGYAKLSLNEGVFGTCKQVFDQGGSVLIFPEGNHGEEYFLRPLTKGAARLALQSEEANENNLHVLPIGINYFTHRDPRSTVILRIGKPIKVSEYLSEYERNQATGLIRLRDDIRKEMKNLLVLPEQSDDYKVRKKGVFQEKNASLSFDELRALEVVEDSVKRKKSRHLIAKFLNPIPYLIIHEILKRESDVVFHATFKFGVGLLIFPLCWLLIFLVLWSLIGINVAALAVIVMVSGLFYSYQK